MSLSCTQINVRTIAYSKDSSCLWFLMLHYNLNCLKPHPHKLFQICCLLLTKITLQLLALVAMYYSGAGCSSGSVPWEQVQPNPKVQWFLCTIIPKFVPQLLVWCPTYCLVSVWLLQKTCQNGIKHVRDLLGEMFVEDKEGTEVGRENFWPWCMSENWEGKEKDRLSTKSLRVQHGSPKASGRPMGSPWAEVAHERSVLYGMGMGWL